MADKRWKQFERRVAEFFGTVRNPLSGANSRHTASDSLSDLFFIESKTRTKFAHHAIISDTRRLAKKEGKIPVLATQKYCEKTFYLTIDKQDTEIFCLAFLRNLGYDITK